MSTLLLQTGDALLLETGDRLLLMGLVPLRGAVHGQGTGSARLGKARPVVGQAAAQSALAGPLGVVGKIEITLDWEESPSPDVAAYNVYRSLDGPVILRTSYRNVAGPPWIDTVPDDLTATVTYLIRAVDAEGNEEGNIREMVLVAVEAGTVVTALPAEPRMVEARAIAGGRIELEWLYDPRDEIGGPGAAHEARIYWDAGTGEVDFTEPHATVPMNNPTTATRYTWQSAPLTNDVEYRFTIRIATAKEPYGVETENTNTVSAMPLANPPQTPQITAQAI